jgi:hypothetical protein
MAFGVLSKWLRLHNCDPDAKLRHEHLQELRLVPRVAARAIPAAVAARATECCQHHSTIGWKPFAAFGG